MSTRFYFAPFDRPPISPAVSSNWEGSTAFRGSLKPTPEATSPVLPSPEVIPTSGSASLQDNAGWQFISAPLPQAVTLTGTFDIAVVAYEVNAASNLMLQVIIRVLSGDGTVVRGTAYAGQTNTTVVTTEGAQNKELGTTATVAFWSDITLSDVNALVGDRIVVEIGVRNQAGATSGAVGFYVTDNDDRKPIYDLQKLSTPSLSVGIGTPNAPTFTRPWIEFSEDLYPLPGIEEYKFTDEGVVLNSSPTLPFVDITSIDGVDSTSTRLNQHDREGMHGGYVSSEFESTRTITIEGNIYATPTTVEAYLDTLKTNFQPTRRDRKFYMTTETGERFVWGKSQGLRYKKDSFRRLGIIPFQVQIVCADPRMYSREPVVVTATVSSLVQFANIDPGGNRDTPGMIHLWRTAGAANVGGIDLENRYGRFTFDYAGSLAAFDLLTIDLDRRTMLRNYAINVRNNVTTTGNWVLLAPTGNRFTIRVPGGENLTYRIEAYPAWR